MLYILGGIVIISGILYAIGLVRKLKGKGKVDHTHRKPRQEKSGWDYHPITRFKKYD